MKRQNHSLIDFALTGMGFGFPITLVCMILIGGFNGVVAEFLTWMAASALFGIITGILNGEKCELKLPAAMALHCVLCLAVTIAAGAICGYADSFLELLKGILPVFVIVYVIVYAVCILLMKREEKKINEALKDK